MRISDIDGATPRKLFRDKPLTSYNLENGNFGRKRKIRYSGKEKDEFLEKWTKDRNEVFVPRFVRDPLNIDDISQARPKDRSLSAVQKHYKKMAEKDAHKFYCVNIQNLKKKKEKDKKRVGYPPERDKESTITSVRTKRTLSRMASSRYTAQQSYKRSSSRRSRTKRSSRSKKQSSRYTPRQGYKRSSSRRSRTNRSNSRKTSSRYTLHQGYQRSSNKKLRTSDSYNVLSKDFAVSAISQTDPSHTATSNFSRRSHRELRQAKKSKIYRKAKAMKRHLDFSKVKKRNPSSHKM